MSVSVFAYNSSSICKVLILICAMKFALLFLAFDYNHLVDGMLFLNNTFSYLTIRCQDNAHYHWTRGDYPEVLMCACKPGYILNDKKVCTAKDDFCTSLTNPTDGTFAVSADRKINSVATLTCTNNKVVTGESKIKCEADGEEVPGKWSASTPTCEYKDDFCLPLTVPAHGIVSFTANRNINSIATFKCDSGYVIKTPKIRTCVIDGIETTGKWSESNPICEAKDDFCTDVTAPTGGTVVKGDGRKITSIATYACSSGKVIKGSSTRTCEADGEKLAGKWSGSKPTCEDAR